MLGALVAVVSVIGVVPAAAQTSELPTVTAHVTDARVTEGKGSDSGVVEIARTGDRSARRGYRSTDEAGSWNKIANVPVDPTGSMNSPGSLTRLEDGRLVITYGYRSPPFGVRARISDDDGESWSDEVVLRADGGSFDLGYTEDELRPDGKIVTTYYFTSDPLAERTIQATIWDPIAAFGQARKG